MKNAPTKKNLFSTNLKRLKKINVQGLKIKRIKVPKLKKSRLIFKTLNATFWALLLAFFLHFVYIFFLKIFFPPFTFTQLHDIILHVGDSEYDFQRDYVPFEEMSVYIKVAVLASEDNLFLLHEGFDEAGILKAIEYNKKHPNSLKGASTISQQVAKNVFLWQKKSWFRKGLEAYYTAIIEKFWNKKRILEVYLNVIEMGPGIFGIEAASQYYFNKSAKNLTLDEAIRIVVCLPNPKYYHPINLNDWQKGKVQRVYNNFEILTSYPETLEALN